MSTPAFLAPHHASKKQHRFSTTNSISSSSIVTVQRAATPQSPLDTQTLAASVSAQGPLTARADGRGRDRDERKLKSPERKRRSDAAQNRSSSAAGLREGVGNLNRWSQSTGSSGSTHDRRSSFSKRLSFGASNPSSNAHTAPPTSPPVPRNFLTKNRPGTAGTPGSPVKQRRPPPAPAPLASSSSSSSIPRTSLLPPILTLPSLSHAVNAADASTPATVTPSTAGLLTPSTYSSSNPPDYFGEAGRSWRANSPSDKKTSPHPTRVAPSPISPASSGSNWKTSSDPPPAATDGAGQPASSSRHNPPRRPSENVPRDHRGHSRGRDTEGKDSAGTDTNSSVSSVKSRGKDKAHGSKHPSQKAMLSKALQKANTAVLLDNAQNFEGAIDAYKDACALLQKVMSKSSANDEKKKLEAIRTTYTNRVKELVSVGVSGQEDGKALPKRPESDLNASRNSVQSVLADTHELGTTVEPSTAQRVGNRQSFLVDPPQSRRLSASQAPPRRESLMPSFDLVEDFVLSTTPAEEQHQQHQHQHAPRSWSRSPLKRPIGDHSVTLRPPMERDYMPPPLSPRRALTPEPADPPADEFDGQQDPEPSQPARPRHIRAGSSESTSWLDTIDESGGSSASSVHSVSSSTGVRRRRLRAASGATEEEFDAALDAAVEAAYDEGYEPADDPVDFQREVISNVRRNVELAKQKAREAEREAEIQLAKQRERERLLGNVGRERSDSIDVDYDDEEAEEEERMLEEMTRGFVMDDHEYDRQSKSALPRQSDSSGFSGRTWGSSIGSNPTTAATSLQTLPETQTLPPLASHLQSKGPQPPLPAPTGALPHIPPSNAKRSSTAAPPAPTSAPPKPPTKGRGKPPSLSRPPSQSVRSRRLSGQQHKQLKIETSTKLPRDMQAPLTQPTLAPSRSQQSLDESLDAQPMTASMVPTANQTKTTFDLSSENALGSRQDALSPVRGMSPLDDIPSFGAGGLRASKSQDSIDRILESPERSAGGGGSSGGGRGPLGGLRKNFSSTSLKNRNISVSSPEGSESSPGTPLGASFTAPSLRRANTPSVPTLPTPTLANFQMSGLPTGAGLHLFESNIHSPHSPGSPNPLAANAPIPLEPCPVETILRPFWLMRCFYQTITHPRGGYLSTRLFVPRDVWRVKNVKIKGVEEKISNCDLLTAALQNLGKVDTFDADAVLEEMQSLETVLDQVQTTLQKKLGSEVGVQGSMAMFKDAARVDADAAAGGTTNGTADGLPGTTTQSKATSGSSGKSGYLSWKRLRPKTSGAGLGNAFTVPGKDGVGNAGIGPGARDGLGMGMSSLPMASNIVGGAGVGVGAGAGAGAAGQNAGNSTRIAKRDLTQAAAAGGLSGPNAAYMNSLARLFDAAQVLGMYLSSFLFSPSSPKSILLASNPTPSPTPPNPKTNTPIRALDQIARQAEDPGLKHSSPTQVGLELSTRHAAEFFGFYICRFVLVDISTMIDKFIKRGSEWVLT